ncbi:MAG: Amuc_1101 family PilM-like pilus complex protein [Luteolibacter sp.]
MAETPTSVAINIGSQRISVAVFEESKTGGLVLKAFDSESISADPSLEASRISQTQVALSDLAARLKLGKTKARYAISGQAVFTRFVKLPALQDDNIEQLVTFEAQQHVPFPLDEVVWDYELIESAAEKEAVLVAIKSESLDEINNAVNEAGIGTTEVDVAPMALYNAFRAAYGQLDESVLLIDIGAKTSNLLYIEGSRFFTRSIPVGGASITAAIAKEYNVSFAEAEHQKVSNGLVALGGGHTEQLDDAIAALAMVIRNALTRLPAEIARTTNYYRSQHGGSAPRRIILAGGGANLPYTLEFFHEKLNLPVEYFNPAANLVVGKGVNPEALQREAHTMGELIGLGLRGIGKSSINIDLVPAVVEQARAADRRKPLLIAAAAILLGGTAIWAALQHVSAKAAVDSERTMTEQRDTLAPIKADIDQLLKREQKLRELGSSWVSLESDHVFWMDLLSELSQTFASDAVWITSLEPLSGYNPLIQSNDKKQPSKAGLGKSVVKDDFATGTYGNSALAVDKADQPLVADALRLKGYWRKNPKNQDVVSILLKNLKEKTTCFSFSATPVAEEPPAGRTRRPAPRGNVAAEPVELSDEQILDITISGDPGEFGLPFEITLPLARPVTVR